MPLLATVPPPPRVFGLDPYVDGANGNVPNPAANSVYTNVDGVLAWCGNEGQFGPTTIVNGSPVNSDATIKAILTGSGQAFANGIQSFEQYGPTSPILNIQNYGTVDGEVLNHDGTAAGINSYANYGGLTVTNYEGATVSAAAPYYAAGIYGQIYNGDIQVINDGTAQATATGGRQGTTANTAFATGIDLFTYAGNLTLTNNGSVTGTTSGTPNGNSGGEASNVAYGVFLWSEDDSPSPKGGAMTFTNNGMVTATSSHDPNAGAKALYCGGNGGPQTVNNYGSIISHPGPKGGWALGVESDKTYPINVFNSGTLSCDNGKGLGIGMFENGGTTKVNNTGSIYGDGRGISADTCVGPITIYNHGSLKCGTGDAAMFLGSGNDAAYFYGLPPVAGVLNGGGGTNSLVFHLTGVLQTFNGTAVSSGATLASFGSALNKPGSMVVGGQTYSWSSFNVTGATAKTDFANGTYKIINRLSGKALGTHQSGTANGTIVEQFPYGGGNPQRWMVTGLGNGRYKISSVAGGRVLEVRGGLTTDGATIDIYDYVSGAANEQWILVPTDSGYFTMTPANALGSCMDVANASTSDLAPMNLWILRNADAPNSGGYDEQWSLQAP